MKRSLFVAEMTLYACAEVVCVYYATTSTTVQFQATLAALITVGVAAIRAISAAHAGSVAARPPSSHEILAALDEAWDRDAFRHPIYDDNLKEMRDAFIETKGTIRTGLWSGRIILSMKEARGTPLYAQLQQSEMHIDMLIKHIDFYRNKGIIAPLGNDPNNWTMTVGRAEKYYYHYLLESHRRAVVEHWKSIYPTSPSAAKNLAAPEPVEPPRPPSIGGPMPPWI